MADLHISVPEVEVDKLGSDFVAEKSQDIRKRVNKARLTQIKRYQNNKIKLELSDELKCVNLGNLVI